MSKIRKIILLFIAFSAFTIVSVVGQEKTQLKVMCYNLRFGELASLEELGSFIKLHDPDVVALQEVDVNTYREIAPMQNGKNFISELAYRTGMLSAYGKTIPYKGGYYGIAILSKFPINKTERVLLPMPEGAKEQRAYLVNEIELPSGSSINFVSTHLDYTTSSVRQIQVATINQDLLNRSLPTILCGDFNAKPDSEEMKEGMKDWMDVSSVDFTIPAKSPKSKIDYIFCYPTERWKSIAAETPSIQLSDHLPVIATVELEIDKSKIGIEPK